MKVNDINIDLIMSLTASIILIVSGVILLFLAPFRFIFGIYPVVAGVITFAYISINYMMINSIVVISILLLLCLIIFYVEQYYNKYNLKN